MPYSCIQLKVITVMNTHVKDECNSTEVYLTLTRCENLSTSVNAQTLRCQHCCDFLFSQTFHRVLHLVTSAHSDTSPEHCVHSHDYI